MKHLHSARGTALAHAEQAGPQAKPQPATGPTFAHAYKVLSHLTGRQYPIENTTQAKPAKPPPAESKTPAPRRFTLRDGNMILKGLARQARWAGLPPLEKTGAPPVAQSTLDHSVLTEEAIRRRFALLQHKLPPELLVAPEPQDPQIE
jgi:hypothetical protein